MIHPMVEKIARAIYRGDITHVPWESAGKRWHSICRARAHAALTALLEPDEQMVEAMVRTKLPALMAHGLSGLPTDGASTRKQIADAAEAERKSFTAAIRSLLEEK